MIDIIFKILEIMAYSLVVSVVLVVLNLFIMIMYKKQKERYKKSNNN